MRKILFVGGTRSGKSALAQRCAESLGQRCLYVATACSQNIDDEMQERIATHQALRGKAWQTWEAKEIGKRSGCDFSNIPMQDVDAILIDCLTLWLSAQLLEGQNIEHKVQALEQYITQCPLPLLMVSSEVGQGIVPTSTLAREFRDWHGMLNQRVAQVCDTVTLVSCGLPLLLKGKSLPVF